MYLCTSISFHSFCTFILYLISLSITLILCYSSLVFINSRYPQPANLTGCDITLPFPALLDTEICIFLNISIVFIIFAIDFWFFSNSLHTFGSCINHTPRCVCFKLCCVDFPRISEFLFLLFFAVVVVFLCSLFLLMFLFGNFILPLHVCASASSSYFRLPVELQRERDKKKMGKN